MKQKNNLVSFQNANACDFWTCSVFWASMYLALSPKTKGSKSLLSVTAEGQFSS